MRIQTPIPALALAFGLLLTASCASAAIVNIDAQTSNGTSLLLAAGTYDVTFVGTSTPGAVYDAWNPYGAVAGQYTDRFAIGFGANYTSNFIQYENGDSSGNAPTYDTAADALAAYQASEANGSIYGFTDDTTPGTLATTPISFTLNAPTTVGFFVRDSYYGDHFGGVSLDLTATGGVPEPATWTLLLIGFGGLGAATRGARRRGLASA